ncbi:zinc ribbon domain-containing protein [soil metagenome]
MPTYEYICDNCKNEFEEIQSIKADALTLCPKCGKETLRRKISGGNALIFKGSGFYLTDYKNKSVDPGSTKKESGTETKEKSPVKADSKSGDTPAKTQIKSDTKPGSKSDNLKSPSSISSSKKSSEE